MKLTPFGQMARTLRMEFDMSMKQMADFMGISSSYLSGIEYGQKRLSQKLADQAAAYFSDKASPLQLGALYAAAEQSMDIVSTAKLSNDARGLVAAFARRLQEGETPSVDVIDWLSKEPRKK